MRRVLILLLVSTALPAAAQAVVRTLDLGDGVILTAQTSSPGVCAMPFGPCTTWHAVGLDIARMDGLLVARTFARVPGTSRIVASVPHRGSFFRTAGLLYTDDRGANWQAAAWPSANTAEAIAFSADGALGVAVGPSRSVWITTDRGLRWIERTSSAGLTYVEVAVLGEAIVIVDESHEAWRSRDRAFSLSSVAGEVIAPLAIEGAFIVITTAHGRFLVGSDGNLSRE